jgi:hypothetical protein
MNRDLIFDVIEMSKLFHNLKPLSIFPPEASQILQNRLSLLIGIGRPLPLPTSHTQPLRSSSVQDALAGMVTRPI